MFISLSYGKNLRVSFKKFVDKLILRDSAVCFLLSILFLPSVRISVFDLFEINITMYISKS